MDAMLGYCGLDCNGCPIHLATLGNEDEKKRAMKIDIARLLKERYGLTMEADDIGDCDGCRSERLFATCAACEIRRCARVKELNSCADCAQFACEMLRKIFLEDTAARARLEALRISI
ncbi:DUF3795 domain-containing protein [bacterium]|nr:MAG: DUF3795 domain-containing protein [bacterium]